MSFTKPHSDVALCWKIYLLILVQVYLSVYFPYLEAASSTSLGFETFKVGDGMEMKSR